MRVAGRCFVKLVEVVLYGKALFVGQLLVGNVKDVGDLLLDGVKRGAGAMVWEGLREKRKKGGEAAGCARGHIVGEGIRPNWAHLAHF